MTPFNAASAATDDPRPLDAALSISDAIGRAVVDSDDPEMTATDAVIVAAGHLALVAGTSATATALRALAVECEAL